MAVSLDNPIRCLEPHTESAILTSDRMGFAVNSVLYVDSVAGQLKCSQLRAEAILRAVMQALRAGFDAGEAATIESSLPVELHTMWPRTAGARPGLADLGDVGFLGRVHE